MKALIIILLFSTMFLIADSTKIEVTVTFYDVTLEQAVELERKLKNEFGGYNYGIEVNKEDMQNGYRYWNNWNGLQLLNDLGE